MKNNITKVEKVFEECLTEMKTELRGIKDFLDVLKEKQSSIKGESYLTKLPKLMRYLTQVTKKKSIRDRYDLGQRQSSWKKQFVEIGINNRGLGLVDTGSQLNSLSSDYEVNNGYSPTDENLKVLLRLFNDEDLCLDVADEILSKHRKDFLKLVSFFRGKDIFSKIPSREISLGDFKVTFNDYWGITNLIINREESNYKEISFIEGRDSIKIDDLSLNNLRELERVVSSKDILIKVIEDKIKEVKEFKDSSDEVNKLVNDMLLPHEALSNL